MRWYATLSAFQPGVTTPFQETQTETEDATIPIPSNAQRIKLQGGFHGLAIEFNQLPRRCPRQGYRELYRFETTQIITES